MKIFNKQKNTKLYNKKTIYFFCTFISLLVLFIFQVIYLYTTKSMTKDILEKKLTFVKLTSLPDLAISTEASYIRHRSLSNIFSIYQDDGALREYAPSSYTISHSNIIRLKHND